MPATVRKSLFLVLVWVLGQSEWSLAQVVLTDQTTRAVIGRQVAILEDPAHQLRSLDEVRRKRYRDRFMPSTQEAPDRGFSTADYWVRFDMSRQTTNNRPYLLEIGFGNFSAIDLYFVSKRTGQIIHKRGGESLGARGREVSYHTFVFYLPTQPGDTQTVYIRLSSTFGQATFPLYIWRDDAFIQSAQLSGLLWGLYYGIFLAVFLYHLSLWLFTRERRYLLLTAYLGAYMLYELSRGYCLGVRFLWPGQAWLTRHSLSTFFTLMIIIFMLLYNSVLDLRRAAPRLQTVLYGLMGLSVVGWLITVLDLPSVSTNFMITLIGVVSGSFIIVLGAFSWYRGYQPARYYWAAAVVIFAGGIIHSLNRAGVIPGAYFLVHYTINLGSLLEFVFLTLGLADTIRVEKRQKIMLQRDVERKVEAAELRGLTDERERVASEIHDNVGSSLLMLRQSLKSLRADNGAGAIYEKLEQMVQETYDEVRKIANNLLPDDFQKRGLALALQELVETLNQLNQTQFYLLLSGAENQLKPGVQLQLYLVIVELINNTIKHAQATEASIRFAAANGAITVCMRDNGVGMTNGSATTNGRGWTNIRHRLERIGGSMDVDPYASKGFSLIVRVPLTAGHNQLDRT